MKTSLLDLDLSSSLSTTSLSKSHVVWLLHHAVDLLAWIVSAVAVGTPV